MASINVGSAHNWTEQQWSTAVEHQVERQVVGMSFMGKGPDATIQLREELSSKKGTQVTVKFSPTEDSDGIGESEDPYATAAQVDLYDDTLNIDYLAKSWSLTSPMDFQRQSSNLKKIIFYKAVAWWRRRFEESILAHLGGHVANNTKTIDPLAVSNLKFAANNTIVATDENHMSRANDLGTDELVAADPTAVLDLDAITRLETMAMSSAYLDYPIGVGQDGWYDLVIDPMGWEQLRVNTTAGQFNDIQLAAMKGGAKQSSTGLANGWMGVFSRTRIHVSDFTPKGTKTADSTAQDNTRRALFLGRCAGAIAFGIGYAGDSHIDWSEEKYQHFKWNYLVDSIYGFKTLRFDSLSGTSENYGCLNHTYYTPQA